LFSTNSIKLERKDAHVTAFLKLPNEMKKKPNNLRFDGITDFGQGEQLENEESSPL